jgi:DNA primase
MISERTIENVRNSADLVAVVEEYVSLKKQGNTYVGLSPFNHEKTPSFKVQPSKNIWFDFSSGKGGDVFSIVMQLEGLTYPEAIEKLADKFNIPIEYDGKVKYEAVSSATLEIYNSWCMENLQKNKEALSYLYGRGVTDETIREFEIGYSPTSREVVDFIRGSVVSEKDAVDLGVIDIGDNGLYARFIDRLMFPIRNHTGKLCGFSGRTMGNHPAKYVNTKDTPLFKKSQLMYGFDKAKDIVSKKEFFVLTEGQMDVVMMHQVGIKYTFASMGTSFTESHAKLIKRFSSKGIIAYDGDKAGINAAFKAAEIMIRSSIDASVIIFKDDEDPADIISSGNADDLLSTLTNGTPAIQFCVDRILLKYDLNNPFDKTKAFSDIESFSRGMLPTIQQAVIGEAASRIGPIKISYKDSNRTTVSHQREKELIKTALLSTNKEDINEIVEIRKCFSHKEAIDAIIKGELSSGVIAEILLDDLVPESMNFKEDIKVFKVWCLKRFLASIKSSTKIPLRDKVMKTREIQAKIQALGE